MGKPRSRFYIEDRAKSQDAGLANFRSYFNARYWIIDRTTGRSVDEASTQYEARQALAMAKLEAAKEDAAKKAEEEAAKEAAKPKEHSKDCLANAAISAIQNFRDNEEMNLPNFRWALDRSVLTEADSYLDSGLQSCVCGMKGN